MMTNSGMEETLKAEISTRMRVEEELSRSIDLMHRTMDGVIRVVAMTVQSRDPYTAGHQIRVAELAWAIAEEMDLPLKVKKGVRMAGMIHDLGKISIPAEILSKPDKLTDTEFSLIKQHPRIGFEILRNIDFPWPLAEIVYQHHERCDGSGYPRGLGSGGILIEARILTVADVVEAMSSHRPYRAALGLNAALSQIKNKKGAHYDTDAVDACVKLCESGKFRFSRDGGWRYDKEREKQV
jgi:putative nucleotidyltransferase with HDIG domain